MYYLYHIYFRYACSVLLVRAILSDSLYIFANAGHKVYTCVAVVLHVTVVRTIFDMLKSPQPDDFAFSIYA